MINIQGRLIDVSALVYVEWDDCNASLYIITLLFIGGQRIMIEYEDGPVQRDKDFELIEHLRFNHVQHAIQQQHNKD